VAQALARRLAGGTFQVPVFDINFSVRYQQATGFKVRVCEQIDRRFVC
jgi:hypothetical protein